MEPSDSFNPDDIRRLKSATSKLLERADGALTENEDPAKSWIFGKAAPALTLATLAKLLVALAHMRENDGSQAPELNLSDADMVLVEGFLRRTRKRDRQQAQARQPIS